MTKNIWLVVVLMLVSVSSSTGQTNERDVASDSAIRESKPPDLSKWLFLILAAEGGGGVLSGSSGPTAYGGGRIGIGPAVFRVGYDRIQAFNGFSFDAAGLLPVARFPGPQKDDSRNFIRIYAEPGVGNRIGSGSFGGYASTRVMVALLSNKRLSGDTWKGSPFVEVERRYPFKALGQGDTRLTVGFMLAITNH